MSTQPILTRYTLLDRYNVDPERRSSLVYHRMLHSWHGLNRGDPMPDRDGYVIVGFHRGQRGMHANYGPSIHEVSGWAVIRASEAKSAAAVRNHGERCRCISLWQPWASLMACGAKHLETRPWNTKVRGRVCIHAAQTRTGILDLHNESCNPNDDTGLKLVVAMEKALDLPFGYWREKLPFGAIIAEGEIYDTATAAEGLARFPDQEPFGDFSPGRFVHLYRDLKPITPIPCKGKQGFFFTELPTL